MYSLQLEDSEQTSLPTLFHTHTHTQAPWSLTFWLVYEEIRVLAGVGNF